MLFFQDTKRTGICARGHRKRADPARNLILSKSEDVPGNGEQRAGGIHQYRPIHCTLPIRKNYRIAGK